MDREGVPLIVSQLWLVQATLGMTSIYLRRIDKAEIIQTIQARAR
jgi:hypothetical protein